MTYGRQTQRKGLLFTMAAITLAGAAVLFVVGGKTAHAQTNSVGGSPGPLADSCGVPAQAAGSQTQGGGRGTPVVQPGRGPVKLQALSLLGGYNSLPNTFRQYVLWEPLPGSRLW